MSRPLIASILFVAIATPLLLQAVPPRVSPPGKGEPPAFPPLEPGKAPEVGRKFGRAQIREFMEKKLKASQDILEGLVTDDMKKVSRGASVLARMSTAEEWRVSNDAIYRQHSQEFRRKVQSLKALADKQKQDAAALKHMSVVMSCIECHKYSKSILIAENKSNPSGGKK